MNLKLQNQEQASLNKIVSKDSSFGNLALVKSETISKDNKGSATQTNFNSNPL